MTPPALISCIVPTHDSERYLDRALASIRAQTWPAIEIVVADDDSSPASRDALSAIARRHGARVERHPRSGPAGARNFGVERSRGQFVAFLDADDLWHPDKLTRQSRETFDEVGPLAPELWFSDSADWFLRAADLRRPLHQIDQALVFHRVHGANLSQRDGDASAREFLRVMKTSLDRRRAAAATDADR
jgi:glycosyltransferase involved in cell wall biosynthesis